MSGRGNPGFGLFGSLIFGNFLSGVLSLRNLKNGSLIFGSFSLNFCSFNVGSFNLGRFNFGSLILGKLILGIFRLGIFNDEISSLEIFGFGIENFDEKIFGFFNLKDCSFRNRRRVLVFGFLSASSRLLNWRSSLISFRVLLTVMSSASFSDDSKCSVNLQNTSRVGQCSLINNN